MTNSLMPHRTSVGPSPVRALASVRRTSSIDVTWPEGLSGPLQIEGHARDLVTPRNGGAGLTVAESSFSALVGTDRKVTFISSEPPRVELQKLVGVGSGGGFRRALAEAVRGKAFADDPLHLVLDDLPGAVLVSGVAWSEWDPDWLLKVFGETPMEALLKLREGACFAHAPGSSAQDVNRTGKGTMEAIAADLRRADDQIGWHAMPDQDCVGFRRVRRIDVTLDEVIRVESEFQDSTSRPDGTRGAVHEYSLSATADRDSFQVLSLSTVPRVLPYPECPAAAHNLSRLLGMRLPELRAQVPVELAGIAGCTHLNDAVRAFAEIPCLIAHIR